MSKTTHSPMPLAHDDLQALWREVGEMKVAVGRLDSAFGAVRSEIGALRETVQRAMHDQRPNTLGIISAVIGAAGVAITIISLLVGGMTWALYREMDRNRLDSARLHQQALDVAGMVSDELREHQHSGGHPDLLSRTAVLEALIRGPETPADWD